MGVVGAVAPLFPLETWPARIAIAAILAAMLIAFLITEGRDEARRRDEQERRDNQIEQLTDTFNQRIAIAGSSLGTRARQLANDIELFAAKRRAVHPRPVTTTTGRKDGWTRLDFAWRPLQRWRTITVEEFTSLFSSRLRDITDELAKATGTNNISTTLDDTDPALDATLTEIATQIRRAANHLP